MIKLGNLERWLPLPQGKVLTLDGEEVRRILLTVNSPATATLWLVNEDGELQFLAAPVGREEVEFYAGGNVRITTDDEHVYLMTAESEADYVIVEDPEVFTEIAQRAARNPELEKLMYLQQVNMERRLAAMMAEFSRDERQARAIPAVSEPAPPAVGGDDKGPAGGDNDGKSSDDDKSEDKSAGTGKSGGK